MRSAHAFLLLLVACTTESREEARRQPPVIGPQLSGTRPLGMRNCPSAVPSAKTTLAKTDRGVELTITSDDPEARGRILTLARLHSTQREPIWGMPPHTGMHGGPNAVGFCPIIHVKTTVTHAEIPQGVRIRVTADQPSMVTFLQQSTELRVRALLQPSS